MLIDPYTGLVALDRILDGASHVSVLGVTITRQDDASLFLHFSSRAASAVVPVVGALLNGGIPFQRSSPKPPCFDFLDLHLRDNPLEPPYIRGDGLLSDGEALPQKDRLYESESDYRYGHGEAGNIGGRHWDERYSGDGRLPATVRTRTWFLGERPWKGSGLIYTPWRAPR